MDNANKTFKKYKVNYKNYNCIIEEDLPEVGWYLYINIEEENIYDYLQDTLQMCKEFAFEEFGIPMDIWEEVVEQ